MKKASQRTKAIHGQSKTKAWTFDHHIVPPITASTTFRLESLQRGAAGFASFASDHQLDEHILIYDRLDEPMTMMLESQLAMLESAECAIAFSSGMGAIATLLNTLTRNNDRIIAHQTLYGCTYSLLNNWLPRHGIQTQFVDLNQFDFEKELKNQAIKVIYFESVSNPNLEVIDIEKICRAVKKANKKRKAEDQIYVVVDNTFATPWGMRPIEWGADFTIQSLTKNISGFGTEMGGAIMTSKKHESMLKLARKDFGAITHPSSAWHILVYGISTQAIRFTEQQKNAMIIARFLEKHPQVEKVIYPGLVSFSQKKLAKKYLRSPEGEFSPGTMIAFTLKGNMKKCERFIDDIAKNSYSITLAVSLGLNKTLIEVPGFMTHSAYGKTNLGKAGIDQRLIRLSLGLESSKDLIADLKAALERI